MRTDSPSHTYTEPPARIREALSARTHKMASVEEVLAALPDIPPAETNHDGETEQLDGISVVHRFVDAPGDSQQVRWHLVECGPADAETVVFLHGVPDSWWQWHHALEALGGTYRCLAIDLRGYGQSDKRTGDYRQEGVAIQLQALLDQLGVDRFSLITHDRGTPVGDHLVARMGERVVRYGRGQQHLWHLHPDLHRRRPCSPAPRPARSSPTPAAWSPRPTPASPSDP
ncbi:alpha/beta fold hydrolase [Streptomyces sp. NPDC002550]